ncbi:unnamed protein product [Toxocara canis]|uniref:Peptidase A2 domain-containing protein n=1 Tax=Toxocara canis TaxID=6265 RepID=A0A183V8S8_TOXCA|nr:unnamed protein product [Toxocara canis]
MKKLRQEEARLPMITAKISGQHSRLSRNDSGCSKLRWRRQISTSRCYWSKWGGTFPLSGPLLLLHRLLSSSPSRYQQHYRSSFTIQTTAELSTSGSTDGSTLGEAAKARLIVSKLDATAHARFTNHILPKRAFKLCFDDTVRTLKELLGHNTSIFAHRYTYLRTQRNGESLSDYTGMVNRRHEMAEFNVTTPEQMKCLVWICGLHTPDGADIRTRALRKMEDNPQTTLKELSLEIQQFLNISRDAKLPGSPPSPLQPAVNAVAIKKKCHKKGYCKNFTNKKRNQKNSRATSNVVVITFTGTDVAPVSRFYRKVKINGATIQMRLDTGADITLLSVKDWIEINRPKLLPSLVKLKSANNKDIKFVDISSATSTLMGTKEEETATLRIPSRYLALIGEHKTGPHSDESQKAPSARRLPH